MYKALNTNQLKRELCGKCSQQLDNHNQEYCNRVQRLDEWHHGQAQRRQLNHLSDVERKRKLENE